MHFVLEDGLFMSAMRDMLIRYFGTEEHVLIKSSIEIISDDCFWECENFSQVAFESGSRLRVFGNRAFSHSTIASIRIPRTVEIIGASCFSFCKSLFEITFDSGSGLRVFGDSAFSHSTIASIRIPRTVEIIGASCFRCCKSLFEITFDSGSRLRKISYNAFDECAFVCVRIPDGFNLTYKWPCGCRVISISLLENIGKEWKFH
jgi:hypothetical protein